MKRSRELLLAAGLLATSLIAHAASFDCADAKISVEKMVCSDPRLSRLDDELSAIYRQRKDQQRLGEAIVQSQRSWLKNRNRCGDLRCLDRLYMLRLVELHKRREAQFEITKGNDSRICQAVVLELNAQLARSPYRVCALDVVGSMREASNPASQVNIADNKDLYRRFKLLEVADARQFPSNLDPLLASHDGELTGRWQRAVQDGNQLFVFRNNPAPEALTAVTEVVPSSPERCAVATSVLLTADFKSIRFSESSGIASRLPITIAGQQYWLGQNLQTVQGVVMAVSDQVFLSTGHRAADTCHIQLSARARN